MREKRKSRCRKRRDRGSESPSSHHHDVEGKGDSTFFLISAPFSAADGCSGCLRNIRPSELPRHRCQEGARIELHKDLRSSSPPLKKHTRTLTHTGEFLFAPQKLLSTSQLPSERERERAEEEKEAELTNLKKDQAREGPAGREAQSGTAAVAESVEIDPFSGNYSDLPTEEIKSKAVNGRQWREIGSLDAELAEQTILIRGAA